jgi:hypothetical protein
MTLEKQIALAGSRIGRIQLHLFALKQDKKIKWHVAGIIREIKGV